MRNIAARNTADGKPIPAGGIESTFKSTIQPFFADEGVEETILITSDNIEEMFSCDIVIISGGDTPYLLETIEKHDIAQTLKAGRHGIRSIVGISAGAIALAEHGIGTKNGQETVFDGIGLFTGTVVPHASASPDHVSRYGDGTIGLGHEAVSEIFRFPDSHES